MSTLDLARAFLGQLVEVVMDRPLGSHHPSYPTLIYPVNYGYVPHTLATDGEALDAYYLGVDIPLTQAEGVCIAIIHRLNDDDDKLVVVPVGMMLSDADIRAATHFQEQYFTSEIIH